MSEQATIPRPPETLPPEDIAVNVDGYLGRELNQYNLSSLTEPMLGSDRFTEVYFDTTSGNQYAIVERRKLTQDGSPNKFLLVNKGRSLERLQEQGYLHTTDLQDEEIDAGSLVVGAPFYFGKGGKSTSITKITAVNTDRTYKPDHLNRMTNGHGSNVRQEFWESLRTGSIEVKKQPPEKSISIDDEALVKLLMFPDEGSPSLYNKLIGSTHSSEKLPWNPEKQIHAQNGMRELFRVELDPIGFKKPGIDGARQGLRKLQTDPLGLDALVKMEKAGRSLSYQGVLNYDDLKNRGDFLHFGVPSNYANAPDKLKDLARVYVTPKLEAVGHVAAEVIRLCREKGFEPYGKVWDESTNNGKVSTRTERLLFYPATESHLRVVMEALRQVSAREPDLFEPDPPLLTERTDIPGVGLAEEPRLKDKHIRSFNQSREELLHEAWQVTLDQLAPSTFKELVAGNRGKLLERRLVDLRDAAMRDEQVMQRTIDVFRQNVRAVSPKYGVSPDNFARNL